MKKLKKLAVKKITLQDLDEPIMEAMAGGNTGRLTCVTYDCSPKTVGCIPKTETCCKTSCI